MTATPRPEIMSTKRGRIAELAGDAPDMAFFRTSSTASSPARTWPRRRLIGKWLNARILEEGTLTPPETGIPQGGMISPRLANIVLHYVLDDCFEREVRRRLKGEAFLILYADDFVIGVAREDDAGRIMDVLSKRMSRYGLTVHPEKTRLIRFQPAAADSASEARDRPGPRTFDFLGFTHYWVRSHRGGWVVKCKTAKGRLKRGLQSISSWCRAILHQAIALQHQKLSEQLRGRYAYDGVIGNFACLSAFLLGTRRIWRRRLSRRGRSPPLT